MNQLNVVNFIIVSFCHRMMVSLINLFSFQIDGQIPSHFHARLTGNNLTSNFKTSKFQSQVIGDDKFRVMF